MKFTFHSIMMNAECLPTEIWFEIFSYLRPHQNIRAFLHLNRFFDRFASTKYFGDFYCITKEQCTRKTRTSAAWKLRLHTMRSINYPPHLPNYLLDFLSWNADNLVQLRKISIYFRRQTMIQVGEDLADILTRLPSLRSIKLRLNVPHLDNWQMKDLLITVFSKQLALTHCYFRFSFENLCLSFYRWSGPSTIRHLSVAKISWSNLCAILSQTQDLVYLKVFISGSQCEPAKFILSSLRKVALHINQTSFALLTNIRRLAPQMNSFLLRGSFLIDDEEYFQQDLWSKILDPIDFHDVLLRNSTCLEDEKTLLRGIYASLVRNRWFYIRAADSLLHGIIRFRSK